MRPERWMVDYEHGEGEPQHAVLSWLDDEAKGLPDVGEHLIRESDAHMLAAPLSSAPEQRQAALLGLGALYDGNALDARRLTLFYPTGGAPEQVERGVIDRALECAEDALHRERRAPHSDKRRALTVVEAELAQCVRARAVLDAEGCVSEGFHAEFRRVMARAPGGQPMGFMGCSRSKAEEGRCVSDWVPIAEFAVPSGSPESDEREVKLPADLLAVLKDPGIIIRQDAKVFELIAKWQEAEGPTGGAGPPTKEER